MGVVVIVMYVCACVSPCLRRVLHSQIAPDSVRRRGAEEDDGIKCTQKEEESIRREGRQISKTTFNLSDVEKTAVFPVFVCFPFQTLLSC